MEIKPKQDQESESFVDTDMKICIVCKRRMPLTDTRQIATHLPPTLSFPMPSGGLDYYCKPCYTNTFQVR